MRNLGVVLVALAGFSPAHGATEAIGACVLSSAAFNPSRGDSVTLGFDLRAEGPWAVLVLDSDGGVVRTVAAEKPLRAGRQELVWDGRDTDGKVVPDEAYTFVWESGGDRHDPAAVSGGEAGDITGARFDREAGTVTYSLPAPARVLVRMGIQGGPMLKTLVDWKPRIGGSITEYWNGRDHDGLMDLAAAKGFTVLITYVTLPDATVIAYGNASESYREYKLGRGKDRPQKPRASPSAAADGRQVRPAGLLPPAWARAPKVLLTLPASTEATNTVPTISGTVAVRVDVDPADKEHLAKDQFEVIFFVDNLFFAEAERGYLPYNFRWETEPLPEGDHILTANISSFKGQVGVASRKVRIEKGKP